MGGGGRGQRRGLAHAQAPAEARCRDLHDAFPGGSAALGGRQGPVLAPLGDGCLKSGLAPAAGLAPRARHQGHGTEGTEPSVAIF